MKEFNLIELVNNNTKLNGKGIFKGNNGVLITLIPQSLDRIVMFLNPKNLGDYAVAVVNEKDLNYVGELPEETKLTYKEIVNRSDFFNHIAFTPLKLKEYDKVVLAVDKPKYQKEGVTKGMIGCIMSEQAINGEHQVIFSENNTGKDIADIMISEEDLILLE